jgi:hypothetical protein
MRDILHDTTSTTSKRGGDFNSLLLLAPGGERATSEEEESSDFPAPPSLRVWLGLRWVGCGMARFDKSRFVSSAASCTP